MTTYLLPCECAADVAVTAGQAGGRVTCGQCGRELGVPKLGALARLRRKDATESGRPATWRPAQAVAFLGTLVAAGATLGAVWVAPRTAGVLDERALRAAVLAVDDLAVYRFWSEGLSRTGVARPPADEELALQRQTRFADSIRGVLGAVAAVAALAALSAGALLLMDTNRGRAGAEQP